MSPAITVLLRIEDPALRTLCARVVVAQGWRLQSGIDIAAVALADSVEAGVRAQLPWIFLTGAGSEELAVRAFRAGACDYLRTPVNGLELAASIRKHARAEATGDGFIGESSAAHAVRDTLDRVSVSDCNVLITGETGTGKELVAELVHRKSSRAHAPFIAINCAAIPEALVESELFGYEKGAFTGAASTTDGKLKLAEGGTVFLDEIGDMAPFAQTKVLRAIESREVFRVGGRRSVPLNVRIVAATNQNLVKLTADGRFREDLYYRLNVARVDVPPLRQRRTDIAPLLRHFVSEFNRRTLRSAIGFGSEAEQRLIAYGWPGNVRELRNLVEATFVYSRADAFRWADVPAHFRALCDGGEAAVGGDDRDRLLSALIGARWNISRASEALKWSRMTVYRKMAKYKIGPQAEGEPCSDRSGVQSA